MSESISRSPLGRYDSAAVVGGPSSELHEVRLLGVPVDLFLATRQQHDDVLREFAVMALDQRDEDASTPPELRRLVRELGTHFGPSGGRTDDEVEAALQNGLPTVDITYYVSDAVVDGANHLESLMAGADDFCRQGRMLTMPRTPAMLSFSAWWLAELRRQVGGALPTPWAAAREI